LAELAEGGLDVLFVARDDVRLAQTSEAVAFFAPGIERLEFPAWDCLPYDRVSPNAQIVSRRIDTLTRLLTARPRAGDGRLVLTTVSAVLQRVPPRETFAGATLAITAGSRLDPGALTDFLIRHGFGRSETVMEPGEFAVRGGIVDVFPPGLDMPVRLDFFGDELDAIRTFDPTSQRSTGKLKATVLKPVSEVPLDGEAVERFRTGYRGLLGAAIHDDALYEAVSEGRRHLGMEHWLPLFHAQLETLFDYLPDSAVVLDHQAEEARDARLDLIDEYYQTRRSVADGSLASTASPYNPLPPERLYLDAAEWHALLAEKAIATLSPFAGPVSEDSPDAGGRPGRDFSDARVRPDANVFDDIRDHARAERRAGRQVVITAFSQGSRDRLGSLLKEHGLEALSPVETWAEAKTFGAGQVAMAVLGIERGFAGPDASFISEQDILGERMNRPSRRKIRPENVIADATALSEGDLVVHVDHGIGRYDGLATIEVSGAPHDCLRILYDGGDKLFLPVENIEVLSRYGSDQVDAPLDRLGGAAWQARKARLKQRIRDMAEKLIGVAAARQLRPAPVLAPPEGLFEEFCARFPYTETEDQYRAITDTLGDLARGIPADRLICGDVGFGKTEVALRAAFVSVLSGRQVAVVVPTTLLCRQHFQTFRTRFADYPVRIAQLSRLVSAADAKRTKEEMAKGTIDIVIGTHALLAKSITFRDLGLLVVDEEQHFGVAHKERLKQIKADVHVLTLSATPIPRTLQMALSGVRELSLIATPPVDRLAVRTFVLPYDPVIIREAILRERYRGGQTFYVCPRIEDLEGVSEALAKLVPEVNVILAHGRMAPTDLEARVSAFYDGKADILLSTNIIESGLDLPSVNTIIIHRADRFGLAQLYQLRGRVGRSKVRAYAYLTLPPRQKLTPAAEKRLEVMQTLDSLGAGFSLASHDLDIRGAGNLLGEEQSGHIREVGVELYQQMLEEAVAEARGAGEGEGADTEWSPQVGLGMAVLIPESYVTDLGVRLSLYRRIARLGDAAEIDSLAAEMIDRFGPLPAEVDNLLQTVAVKCLCRQAGVARVEAGPRGAVLSFRNDSFANPEGMVRFLTRQVGTAKLRPDQKLVYIRSWDDPKARLQGVSWLMKELAAIAAEKN